VSEQLQRPDAADDIGRALAAPLGPTNAEPVPGLLAFVGTWAIAERLDSVLGGWRWQDKCRDFADGKCVCEFSIRRVNEWIAWEGRDREYDSAFRRAVLSAGVGLHTPAFVPVPDFPGYLVSSAGHVWSRWERGRWCRMTTLWHELKAPPDNHGYLQLNLSDPLSGRRKHFKVHQLVMLVFRGPKSDGLLVRHRNGNQLDNRLCNLAYGTYAENAADTVGHGRTNRGERCHAAKLTASDIVEIRRRSGAGELQKALAAEYGVATSTLCQIVKRTLCAHIP
jgi:hypothetical protein